MKKLLAQLVLALVFVGSVFAASSPLTQTVNMGTVARTSSTWTNGTSTNSAVTLAIANAGSVSVTANTTSTITAGMLTFELSDDGGTNYFPGGCTRTGAFTTDQTYALLATTKQSWNCQVAGFTHFRVRLSTPISGTGQAIIAISGSASTSDSDMVVGQSNPNALQMTVGNPLPAGTNNMGNVGLIDSAGVNKATVTPAGAVKTDPSGVTTPISSANLELSQGSTTSGQKGPLMQGAVTTAAPSYTTAQTMPFSLTPTGGLRIDMATCSGCSLDSSAFSATASSSSTIGGVFNDSLAALSSGQQGAMRLTAQRAGHMNPRDAAGGQLFPTGFSSANAIAAQTASFIHGGMMGWTGTAWNMLTLDGSNYLQVNCKTGCAGASDGTGTGSLAAANNTVSLVMTGTFGAAVEFASGTLAGTTVVAEISTDGGTTWNSAVFTDPIAGLISTSLSNPTSAQYGIVWPIGGVSHARVRVSVYGSGSVTANMRGTVNNGAVLVYGSDGTNIRPMTTTPGGIVKIDLSGTGANATAIKVDNSAVTQPISAASLPLPTGASTAAKQPALGTAGTPSADVITVQGAASMIALKTDGSAVTQPVSIATAPILVAGSAIIGKVGIDQTTPGTTNLVALAPNQSVNTAQINGVTPLMGAGNTGTGSPRFTLATDQAAIPTWGKGATGSAVPSGAQYTGVNSSGNLTGLIGCNNYAKYDASTTGSTQLVALSGSTTIYICGYSIMVGGTATNVKLVYGTGTNCATSPVDVTPAWQILANSGKVVAPALWSGLKTAATGQALCINASAANAVQAEVWYTQF